jgi:hypothetical protein
MFVDPDARNPKEMAWIAQRVWRPVTDVQVDDRYLPAARKKVSARGWSRWSTGDADSREGEQPSKGAKSFCEIIEFYDIRRRTMCTFALDSDDVGGDSGFLIKPRPIKRSTFKGPDRCCVTTRWRTTLPLGTWSRSSRCSWSSTRPHADDEPPQRFQRKWLTSGTPSIEGV